MARALVAVPAIALVTLAAFAGPVEQRAPAAPAGEPPVATVYGAPAPAEDDGQADPDEPEHAIPGPRIAWRRSRAMGLPFAGRLVRGVQFPAEGPWWFTWDPILQRSPDRPWRRYGTDALVRTLLKVVREFRTAHPDAPRIGVGDLSRPRGGAFGRAYGGLGHASHQNGLDADVYYPRKDGLEKEAFTPAQVDRRLAQDLVDRFVEAGAERVFVGPSLRLRGPRRVVRFLVHHDDHLHLRIPQPPE